MTDDSVTTCGARRADNRAGVRSEASSVPFAPAVLGTYAAGFDVTGTGVTGG